MIGVYKIQSIIKPERTYVGSAVDIKRRWKSHIKDLKSNKHGNKRLQNHYNKYGLNDLIFTALLECDKDSLLITEQFFIDSLNPFFNICRTAGSQLGRHWNISIEGRRNMSKGKIGNTNRKGTISHNKGKHTTEEIKKKISIATKKAMNNPELRKKLSDLKKGVKGIGMTGKHHSKETMLKIIDKTSKKVCQYDRDNNFIKEWSSIREAARSLNLYSGNIVACAKNKVKSSGGFIWIYSKQIIAA